MCFLFAESFAVAYGWNENSNATLKSQPFTIVSKKCLYFYTLSFDERDSFLEISFENLFSHKIITKVIKEPRSNYQKWIKHKFEFPDNGIFRVFIFSNKYETNILINFLQLFFKGSNGSIAIDEIKAEICKETEEDTTKLSDILDCSFEKNFCQYKINVGEFKIGLKTPLSHQRHRSHYGKYCYFQPSKYASKGRLFSPIFTVKEKSCLRLIFNMYGYKMGKFEIKLITILNDGTGRSETILRKEGNQGKRWLSFKHSIDYDPLNLVNVSI